MDSKKLSKKLSVQEDFVAYVNDKYQKTMFRAAIEIFVIVFVPTLLAMIYISYGGSWDNQDFNYLAILYELVGAVYLSKGVLLQGPEKIIILTTHLGGRTRADSRIEEIADNYKGMFLIIAGLLTTAFANLPILKFA